MGRMKMFFFSLLALTSLACGGDNTQIGHDCDLGLLTEHLTAANQILLGAPDAFLGEEEGRFYIDETQVVDLEKAAVIELSSGKHLKLPPRFIDGQSTYFVVSRSTMVHEGEKFF